MLTRSATPEPKPLQARSSSNPKVANATLHRTGPTESGDKSMVAGQQVVVRGKVSGLICGKTVALQAASAVEGDVHHMSFAIEKGAMFEGRSRRAANEADLSAVIDAKAGQPKPLA
jgi:hypothetical protein